MKAAAWIPAQFLACCCLLADDAGGGDSLELASIDGRIIAPLRCDGETKFAVVVFITTDCPVANAMLPEINRLTGFVREQGGKLTLVQVDWDLTDADAAQHAHEFGITAPVVVDRKHQLVKATGAEMTPEAVMAGPRGTILYRGRINDLFTDLGDRLRVVAHHDLRDAIVQYANGEPVANPRVTALGCFIPEFPE